MTSEIRRIDPKRAANIIGIQYGLIMGLMAVVMGVFFALVSTVEVAPGEFNPAEAFGVLGWFLLMYPVMGLAFGWLFGFAGATAYNYMQRFTGGFLVELD
jgi:hypothetical protein